ncbi:MAG: CinA family protein [Mycoplasmataceae bacterium]|jgi:nicotinamide-nucleotide amidase|nr:CinA family protein [Mycoplasmataceae bacterium]
MKTFVDEIVDILKKKDLTIATCESITGGMISSNIVNISGSSKVLLGGFVTYSNLSKTKLVNVKEEILNKYGTVSKEVALEMAKGVILKLKSDIAISITGNAGPNVAEDKPIGLAYSTIIVIDKAYTYELQSRESERNAIRIDLSYQVLTRLLDLLNKLR